MRAAAAKFEVLQLLYAHFRTEHLARDTPHAQEFRTFMETQGDPLRLHAIYDALDAHWRLQGPQYWGWPSWPEEYRDPTSTAVNRFARERAEDIEYYAWLQWLADIQLSATQHAARARGGRASSTSLDGSACLRSDAGDRREGSWAVATKSASATTDAAAIP